MTYPVRRHQVLTTVPHPLMRIDTVTLLHSSDIIPERFQLAFEHFLNEQLFCIFAEAGDYDNLSSPTSPGFDDSASAGDAAPLPLDPEERERQIKEWTEELEKVNTIIKTIIMIIYCSYKAQNKIYVLTCNNFPIARES